MYVCRMAWGVEVGITECVWYMCVVCGAWRACVEVGFVCYGVCVRARVRACCVLGSILQKEADFAVGRGGGEERAK